MSKATVLLTGATGFIGAFLAAALVRAGHPLLLLARSRGSDSAEERMRRLFSWLEVTPAAGQVTVLEGKIDLPGFGLAHEMQQEIRRRTERVFHCAATTSFSARARAEGIRINVQAIHPLLALLDPDRCRKIHHISTAFVAGQLQGTIREEVLYPKMFHNGYEKSKWQGEAVMTAKCREAGIPLVILRPAVVYGHSQTGHCLQFNAMYYPVRTLRHLKDTLRRDLTEDGGTHARAYGAGLREGGILEMPIRFESTTAGAINLLPIDYLIEATLAIMNTPEASGIYHIVSPAPVPLTDLLTYIGELYSIAGLRIAPPESFAAAPRSGLERLMLRYLELYASYMQDTRVFDDTRARPILDAAGCTCPVLTAESFARCIRYAESVDWGQAPEW